jgi:hypothetical protein
VIGFPGHPTLAAVLAGRPQPRPAGVSARGTARGGRHTARRSAHVPSGLLSGGTEAEQLRDAGAAEIYRDAAALLEDLDASGIGRLAR